MSKVTLVTGGTRSGKSRFAEQLAEAYPGPRGYLATGQAGDAEMAERIERHRGRRGSEWVTVEEPVAVAETLSRVDGSYSVVLLDCVTLWLANLMFSSPGGAAEALERVREFTGRCAGWQTPLVIVTSEVGMGIVPEHPVSRAYRDLAGEANQLMAAAADEVYVTISGLPLKLK
ncbi:adenosylcobinamide kinase/adenosylcobinamide phosphate guanyltransferase [Geomonas limicola]|uniref:Adenosylcobinamide kinase n=1 Tax=Geomonas limicola TaxID=2740186 RepID=A0A6V8N6V2_9BACT|nr:bifunctional adenosylcobinamide kinase/adenosylcobinamide-phosphate guanylyltransferase [Geomonas limicola]GFO67283.1 adenosylcobinamide kinase/adenosylcobinamide phosphate guanyltransferase [Geomonas limicola]